MSRDEAVQVTERLEPGLLADILDEASPDTAADILRAMPAEQFAETLDSMEDSSDVESLLEYADDVAGGLMTPDFPTVVDTQNAHSAIDTLRFLEPDAQRVSSVIVVGNDGKLVGQVSVIRLALARARDIVGDLVEFDLFSVTADTDQEECARLMQHYDLDKIPVVDETGVFLGVILADDIVDVAQQEAAEDMYRIAGVEGASALGPLKDSVRSRLPWLFVNLGTIFLAASVIALFESTISRAVALAVFLPIVPSMAGMGGVQTLTLAVRAIALGELGGRRDLRLVGRELYLGLFHGLILAVAVAAVAFIWRGNIALSGALGAAMLVNMVVAGLAGAGVPLMLRRQGMDPAVSSAVFVTTLTDVSGIFLFLGLATILITHIQ